jgi:16S rRNA (guanine966-N2)-methyltransferase
MRIVSGFLKGKPIDFLKSSSTRPLRDFVKESVFNVVKHSNIINMTLEDNNILDLYSGVGSFGIECISNGAKKTFFVEVKISNRDYSRVVREEYIIKDEAAKKSLNKSGL